MLAVAANANFSVGHEESQNYLLRPGGQEQQTIYVSLSLIFTDV